MQAPLRETAQSLKPSMPQPSLSKRQQILMGAKQEFLAQGFAATSVDRIATAAGVSKATIYTHFKGKEGLFKALVQQMAQQRLQEINPQLLMDQPPRQVLRHIARETLDNAVRRKEFQAFHRLLIGESDRFPNLSRTFVECMVKPGVENLTQYLAKQPELKVADPEATARVFMGAVVHFAMVQEIMHGKEIVPMERDRLITTLVDLIAPEA